MVIKMDITQLAAEAMSAAWKAEIDRAIDKVKLGMIPTKPRTELDKWWRRQFYRETAMMARVMGYRKGRRWRLRRPRWRRKPEYSKKRSEVIQDRAHP